MVNLYIGITDYDWFSFLAAQDGVDEVNFPFNRRIRSSGRADSASRVLRSLDAASFGFEPPPSMTQTDYRPARPW